MDWVTLFHAIAFMLYWLTNLAFTADVNHFMGEVTGAQLDYVSIFLALSLLVGIRNALRLLKDRTTKKVRRDGPSLAINWGYLVFFYLSFIILFLKNPIQLTRLGQLLGYFRTYIDVALLFLAAWILPRELHPVSMARKSSLRWAGVLVLWLLPIFWPPALVYRGELPPKPLVIAHRGASMLAPENTFASMQLAAELGAAGLETDISITRDGVLFLMHDSTLERTTNIATIFPGREEDPVENFTWGELERLSAGDWYVQQDPFGTLSSFPGAGDRRTAYRQEPIATLSGLLELLQTNGLNFIYDLRLPAAGHPYSEQAFDLCLLAIQNSGVASRTWVLVDQEQIPHVRELLPEAILALGLEDQHQDPTAGSLIAQGYQLVNSQYRLSAHAIRAYRTAGLWVNLWTVDEPWQYSRLWLAGADSTTTNNTLGLIKLERPILAWPYGVFLSVWCLVGALAATLSSWRSRTGCAG